MNTLHQRKKTKKPNKKARRHDHERTINFWRNQLMSEACRSSGMPHDSIK